MSERIPVLRPMVTLCVGLALTLAACGGDDGGLDDLAQETCDRLVQGNVQAGDFIIDQAAADARDLGYSESELRDALRAECAESLIALTQSGGGEHQVEPEVELERSVRIVLDTCDSDGAEGTVTNDNSAAVDVTISVEFLGDGNVQIDTGLDFVRGLSPGQTGQWDTLFFGDGLTQCHATVDSVREAG